MEEITFTLTQFIIALILIYIDLGLSITIIVYLTGRLLVERKRLSEEQVFPSGKKGMPYFVLSTLLWPVIISIIMWQQIKEIPKLWRKLKSQQSHNSR